VPHHVMFDTLKFVETLVFAGMPEKQAKACVEVQKEALEEAFENNFMRLATEKELILTKNELKSEIAEVRTEITTVRTEITAVRNELKSEIAEVKSELKLDIARLQVGMNHIRWMFGVLIIGLGTLIVKAYL
jgi:hypothetical protein